MRNCFHLKADRVVHVWQIPLDRSSKDIGQLVDSLSEEEKTRARRFYFGKDRNRFIVTRGTLRVILASYLDIPAHNLVFSSNSCGKPFLKQPQGNQVLEFNLAHSNNLAVLSVTYGHSVGIDIEFIRPITDYSEVARTAFTESECRALQLVPEDQRIAAFFACWTRKEAYIKSFGLGLSQLREFTVDVEPDVEYVEPYDNSGRGRDKVNWSIRTLNLLPIYIGAVASEGMDWELKLFD
jgi:4'-phosphopantetheinyl transferase